MRFPRFPRLWRGMPTSSCERDHEVPSYGLLAVNQETLVGPESCSSHSLLSFRDAIDERMVRSVRVIAHSLVARRRVQVPRYTGSGEMQRKDRKQQKDTMKRLHTHLLFSLILLLAASAHGCAQDATAPQQVKVITSGGFTAAFDILGPLFEQASGIQVITEYGSSMGGGPQSIPVRLERGETSDLLIFNDEGFDGIAATGAIQPASRVELARSITGVAIRSGAPRPDISTMESFIETLLAAESIGYSASVSGTRLSTVVFPELGIWDQIQGKTTRIVGERVASVVARGEVELGFQARSEILPIEGAEYLGPIPDAIQQEATIVVVMTEQISNMENARTLVEFLSSRAAAVVIDSTGLMPVALEHQE